MFHRHLDFASKVASFGDHEAGRRGYRVRRRREWSIDNQGEFMLGDVDRNVAVLGWRYDASLDEIEDFLRQAPNGTCRHACPCRGRIPRRHVRCDCAPNREASWLTLQETSRSRTTADGSLSAVRGTCPLAGCSLVWRYLIDGVWCRSEPRQFPGAHFMRPETSSGEYSPPRLRGNGWGRGYLSCSTSDAAPAAWRADEADLVGLGSCAGWMAPIPPWPATSAVGCQRLVGISHAPFAGGKT